METKKALVTFNLCNNGSTGKLMLQVASLAGESGYQTYQVYPGRKTNSPLKTGDILICTELENKIYQRICRYTGRNGCSAVITTLKLLSKLDKIQPTVLQLHNMHHSYVNLPILFHYIKKKNIPVVWTLHDCWAFTGHCPHFLHIGCEKWKTGCHGCPLYKAYPEAAFDDSKIMYRLKKKWFCGVKNLTLVTPSNWLAGLVKQSFLREYPVEVIHNGIDLSVFRPVDSGVRKKYGIREDAKLLLAVAYGWASQKKGADVIVALAKELPEEYHIAMVGTDDAMDRWLPKNIISIHRTYDQQELAALYTAADLFVMPSREENYPTVVMESLACGTPVILYNAGGGAEIVTDTTGRVVDCDDYDALRDGIMEICETRPYGQEDCLRRAKEFDMERNCQAYIALYDSVKNPQKASADNTEAGEEI